MSLYKKNEDQTISVEIEVLEDKRIVFDFCSDCGKFGTIEPIGGFAISPEKLFKILIAQRDSVGEDDQ